MTNILAREFSKSTPLAKVYCITGGEPLQTFESSELIIDNVKAKGFLDVIKLKSRDLTVNALQEQLLAMDLFASRKIIEITFDNNKINKDIITVLSNYFENISSDIILSLVFLEKPDSRFKNSKLFKNLKKLDVRDYLTIQATTIYANQLPQWISNYLKKYNLSCDNETLTFLAYNFEGNLLGLAQLIKNLVSAGFKTIDIEAIKNQTEKSANFSVYDLTDAAMLGNTARTLNIFSVLKAQNFEPAIVIWALTREIKTLINMKFELNAGLDLATVAKNNGVMSFKLKTVQRALNRLTLSALDNLIKRLHLADIVVKGAKSGDIWDDLLSICTYFVNSSNSILCEEKIDIW